LAHFSEVVFIVEANYVSHITRDHLMKQSSLLQDSVCYDLHFITHDNMKNIKTI
jgi:hypothetical protein